ncbi:MAG: DUF4160 domain-containing protein [Acetobacteraceae bacterium]|nr:DUF4160 domain-containing protein [Acetobacteraceae bacterium]
MQRTERSLPPTPNSEEAFFFFSNEGDPREPPHIHARGAGGEAKFWLCPDVSVACSEAFNDPTLAGITRAIALRKYPIERAWYDHFR